MQPHALCIGCPDQEVAAALTNVGGAQSRAQTVSHGASIGFEEDGSQRRKREVQRIGATVLRNGRRFHTPKVALTATTVVLAVAVQ